LTSLEKSEQIYDLEVNFLKLISELNIMNNDEITIEYKSISGSVDVSYNLLDLEEQLNIQSYLLQDTLSKNVKKLNYLTSA
jgi:hypothetical protein